MINYNELIGDIPGNWKETHGEDIVIAVVDTGCYFHKALVDTIVTQYNAVKKNDDIDDKSDSSHGTFISGLIAAHNDSNICGIAPKAKLIIVKVTENDFGVDPMNVLEGLKWLIEKCPLKPDIVNISLDFDPFPNQPEFQQIFAKLSDNSTTILAAAQNDSNLFTNKIFYPAIENNVLGVGALNAGNSLLNTSSVNNAVKYVVPNISFSSLIRENNYSVNSGCSFATAAASGVFSLAFSYLKKQNLSLSNLNQNIPILSPTGFDNNLKLYKI